jgi:hypothetical protein
VDAIDRKIRLAIFWTRYESELTACILKNPSKYWGGETTPAPAIATRTAKKMRESVESTSRPSFARINYRESLAFRRAARAVGVPFNLAGLNSLYSEAQ